MFDIVLGISSYIGLAAFAIACITAFAREKLRSTRETADQFDDEQLKLQYLRDKGLLPTGREQLTGKEALREIELRMDHRRRTLNTILIAAAVVFLIGLIAFLASQIGCGDITIDGTGSNSTAIGCIL